ncbi:MAG: hypothetical protein ACRDRQ_27555, partial [Pseudonocardiaceae bacterium]
SRPCPEGHHDHSLARRSAWSDGTVVAIPVPDQQLVVEDDAAIGIRASGIGRPVPLVDAELEIGAGTVGVLVLTSLLEDLHTVLPDLNEAVGSLGLTDVEHPICPASDLLVSDDRVPAVRTELLPLLADLPPTVAAGE